MIETEPQRILVIEDEPQTASFLQRQFEEIGFEVQMASNGAAALNMVEAQAPNLVILDLLLPDISGYRLCEILRRLYDHLRLPIVILTGVEQCTEELRHQVSGADAYFRKPCDPETLLRVVCAFLNVSPETS